MTSIALSGLGSTLLIATALGYLVAVFYGKDSKK